ncbi:hypothetical protein N7448_003445 [Penicillium atrosanguineum]|uniref:uncharacterized protein n=1 Tax=Penicillium atrosanguineum TaxID=1132637 RepID=UPI00239D9427|nr:uncharacterized protein N7443_002412 [Penicillium atrosanguineum]KAJ5122313.1 hypothetical protein N7526_009250 [Penicillium atrosanguineum]KAJ5140037.1 hypothetical protein N7448_003445 [Penicillium atrosanguineum]KAJ5309951.1 hypothetical protein N7443_002412 [Penicillium atrosanguineum]
MASRTGVSVSQFAERFYQSWMNPRGITKAGEPNLLSLASIKLPWKIGLAISGGADSMALALLCKQMEELSDPGTVSFTAFLVDHRARPESSQEANMVAGWLRDMGIKTKVIKLDWRSTSAKAADADPIQMPSAFETNARMLRYQALGKACLQDDINTILLGHHQDDNVETAISRLCSGARGAALGGISEIARIPECHGLWGISEGASYAKLLGTRKSDALPVKVRILDTNRGTISFYTTGEIPVYPKKQPQSQNDQPLWLSLQPPFSSSPLLTATGGIFLCRPLLSFPKARLVQTCEENKVPYVSDPTNFDPTLTTRNTIRHLLSNNALPRALQPASILSLIKTGQDILQKTNDLSDEMLASRCRILDFNPRAGSLAIEFKNTAARDSKSHALDRKILSSVIRRVTDLISAAPAHNYALNRYDPFVSNIFPDARDTDALNKYFEDRKPFNVGGVLFSPLNPKSKMNPTTATPELLASLPSMNTWGLSRAPYMRNRKPIIEFKKDTWKLWDCRHWLRFTLEPDLTSNLQASVGLKPPILVVRPFEKSDLDRILHDDGTLAGEKHGRVAPAASDVWKYIKDILALEADGPARFTIPVLTLEESSLSEPTETPEHLLLMPTFGMCLSGLKKGPAFNEMSFFWKGVWWNLTWDWMYKMIDTEAVRLMSGPSVNDEPTEYGTKF